jgi:hypothetical protein
MSTEIKQTPAMNLTQFFGGVDRGVCLQVTMNNTLSCPTGLVVDNVKLTQAQALELASDLIEWANSPIHND